MRRNTFGILIAQSTLLACLLMPTLAFAQAAQPTNTPTPSPTAATPTTQTAQPNSQTDGTSFVPLTHLPQIQSLAQSQGFGTFVNTFYKILIGVGAVLAVLMIMYAGVQFMTSRGSVASNEKAKSRIQNALLGLLLILSPVIVFNIINPQILQLNLGQEFSGLKGSSTSSFGTNPNSVSNLTNANNGDNSCTVYSQKTIGEGSCSSGWTQIPSDCCSLSTPDQICCGQVGAVQYLLAYTYIQTAGTQCNMYAKHYYASSNDCKTTLNSLPSTIPAVGGKPGSLQILQSCTAVTDTSYQFPSDPHACSSQ